MNIGIIITYLLKWSFEFKFVKYAAFIKLYISVCNTSLTGTDNWIVHFSGFAYGCGPHVIAFTDNGTVYSWGHNGYSELGIGSSNQCLSPTLILPNVFGKMTVVTEVACGTHHSLALTRDGEVQ